MYAKAQQHIIDLYDLSRNNDKNNTCVFFLKKKEYVLKILQTHEEDQYVIEFKRQHGEKQSQPARERVRGREKIK